MAETAKPAGGWTQIYRSIFDQSIIGIVLCDMNGAILECNPAFCGMIGFTAEELARKTVQDLTHPEDWVAEQAAMARSRETPTPGRHYTSVKRYIRKDGRIIWANVNATTICGTRDAAVFGFAIVEDITERKLAEAALRESEERYRSLFSEMTNGFALHEIIVDEAGKPSDYRYLAVNPAFEALTGLRAANVIGRTVREIIPTIEPYWISRFGSVALTGIPATFEDHVEAMHKHFSVHAYSPRPGRFAVVFSDVTDRVHTQWRLEEEKERMSVVLRGISDAVIATDTNGAIVLVNKLAEKWMGRSHEGVLGQPVWQALNLVAPPGQPPCAQAMEAAVRGRKRYEPAAPFRLAAPEGPELWVAVTGNPLFDRINTPVGMVFVLRNISERLRMEAERVKTEKLDSLGHLAAGIAHDFNNYLTTILGNVSLAKAHTGTPAEVTAILSEAETALQSASNLTHQLLTFAKGGSSSRTSVITGSLLKEAADFALCGSKSCAEFNISPSLWNVQADPIQLAQAIRNLVINADEAMPSGGSIQIAAENYLLEPGDPIPLPPGRYVKLSITDSGIGIPDRTIDRIFDPYFTTKQQGSGMGLATTLSIVRNHNGHIGVESGLGIGTTFEVYLPAIEDAAATPPPPEMPPPVPGRIRVLVMDDEEAIRSLTSRILSSRDCDVTTTCTGEEALQAYETARAAGAPFDVVILDLTIRGGMGGKDTIQRLREIDPSVKAIVSSGYSTDPVLSNYRRYGFRGIVPKPYQAEHLVRAVQEVVRPRPVRSST